MERDENWRGMKIGEECKMERDEKWKGMRITERTVLRE